MNAKPAFNGLLLGAFRFEELLPLVLFTAKPDVFCYGNSATLQCNVRTV